MRLVLWVPEYSSATLRGTRQWAVGSGHVVSHNFQNLPTEIRFLIIALNSSVCYFLAAVKECNPQVMNTNVKYDENMK